LEPQTKQQLMQNELVRSATEPDPVAQLPVANLQSTEQPSQQVTQAPVEQEEEPFNAEEHLNQHLFNTEQPDDLVEQEEEEPFNAEEHLNQHLFNTEQQAPVDEGAFNAQEHLNQHLFKNDNLPEQKAVTQGYAEDYWRLDTLGKYREHDKYLNAWRNWTGEVGATDAEAAEGLKSTMRYFNTNSAALGTSLLKLTYGTDEDKKNFAEMFQYWERSENFSDGISSITGYIVPALTDPLNWASGFIGGKVATQLAKTAAKRYMIAGVVAAATDAPVNAAFEAGVQQSKMKVGLQKEGEYDYASIGVAAAIGAGLPIAISGASVGARQLAEHWKLAGTDEAGKGLTDMLDAKEIELTENLMSDIDELAPEGFEMPVIRENYKQQIKEGKTPKSSDPKKGRTVNSLYLANNWHKDVKDVMEDMAVALGPEEKKSIRQIYNNIRRKSSQDLIEADEVLGKTYKSPETIMRLQIEQYSLSRMFVKGSEQLRELKSKGIRETDQEYIRKKMQTMLVFARAQEATAVLKNIRSEWGMIGKVFQATKSLGTRASNVAMRALNDRYGSNFDALLDDFVNNRLDLTDPNAKATKNLHKLALDSGTEWFYNVGMLANADTLGINAVGPIMSIIAKNFEKTVAATLNAPFQAMGMAQGRVSLSDAMARWQVTPEAMKDAVNVSLLFGKENDPVMRVSTKIGELRQSLLTPNLSRQARENIEKEIKDAQRLLEMISQAGRSDVREAGIREGGTIGSGVPKWIRESKLGKKFLNVSEGGIGYLIRTPTRLMGATDIGYRTIAHAQSRREAASRAARAKGLQGPAREAFIRDYIPTNDEMAQALREAEEAAFNQDNLASDVIRSLIQKTGQGTGPIATLINIMTRTSIPFPSTPINLAMWTFERTPLLGAVLSAGKVEAGEIVGRQIVGGSLFAMGAYLYNSGLMTGHANDWREAQTVEAMGEAPLSIRIAVGEAMNISRIDPIAAMIQMGGLHASLMEQWEGASDADKAEIAGAMEFVQAASHIFVRNFLTERTMLQGVSDLTKVMTGEVSLGDWMTKRVAGTIGQMASPPFVRRILQAEDKKVRFMQGDDIWDAISDNVAKGWGFNTDETAPPRTVYGEEVKWRAYPHDWFPMGRGRERPKSAHLLAMNDTYGVPYPPTPKKIYNNYDMLPHERAVYEKAMGAALVYPMEALYRSHEAQRAIMDRHGVERIPPVYAAQMQKAIRKAQSLAREVAEQAVMGYLRENNRKRFNELVGVYKDNNGEGKYEYYSPRRKGVGFSDPTEFKEGQQ